MPMPMTPPATHGPRDAWSTTKPAVGTASQRRNTERASGFDDALSAVTGTPAANLDVTSLPSYGMELPSENEPQPGGPEAALAQESSMVPAEAILDDGSTSKSAASAPVAWTGAEAAAYAQQYGAPYPAATEALATPPPIAGPAPASQSASYGVSDGSVSPQDVASAYADAAGVPETPMQQGFSAVA